MNKLTMNIRFLLPFLIILGLNSIGFSATKIDNVNDYIYGKTVTFSNIVIMGSSTSVLSPVVGGLYYNVNSNAYFASTNGIDWIVIGIGAPSTIAGIVRGDSLTNWCVFSNTFIRIPTVVASPAEDIGYSWNVEVPTNLVTTTGFWYYARSLIGLESNRQISFFAKLGDIDYNYSAYVPPDTNYISLPALDRLVFDIRFQDTNALGQAVDSSTNNQPFTLIGSFEQSGDTNSQGRINKYACFDGIDDYSYITNLVSDVWSNNVGTVCFWSYDRSVTPSTEAKFEMHGNSTDEYDTDFKLRVISPQQYVIDDVNGAGQVYSSFGSLMVSNWVFWVIEHNTSGYYIYTNTVLAISITSQTAKDVYFNYFFASKNPAGIHLGCSKASMFFYNGYIDNFAVWSGTNLTVSELTIIYGNFNPTNDMGAYNYP